MTNSRVQQYFNLTALRGAFHIVQPGSDSSVDSESPSRTGNNAQPRGTIQRADRRDPGISSQVGQISCESPIQFQSTLSRYPADFCTIFSRDIRYRSFRVSPIAGAAAGSVKGMKREGEQGRDRASQLRSSCGSRSVSPRPPAPAPHPPRIWCRRCRAVYRWAAGDSYLPGRTSSAGRTPSRAGRSRRTVPSCSHRAGRGDRSCPAGRGPGWPHIGWRLHTGTGPFCTGGRSQKLSERGEGGSVQFSSVQFIFSTQWTLNKINNSGWAQKQKLKLIAPLQTQ